MSIVTIRLTGEEKAVRQAIQDLKDTLGSAIEMNVPTLRPGTREWIAMGTLHVHDEHQQGVQDLAQSPTTSTLSRTPVFKESDRIRVLSTGRIGTVRAVLPPTPLQRQMRQWWSYVVEFEDGSRQSFAAEVLVPL
ncbi:MAG: hypothetical protein HC884_02365 [Chloroflexaceae bacterium]|nr:hypothetical protein [Chloroflexaceae bacterium]